MSHFKSFYFNRIGCGSVFFFFFYYFSRVCGGWGVGGRGQSFFLGKKKLLVLLSSN